MKLLTLCITTAAAAVMLAATAGPAFGQIANPLNSADFTYKYEFNVDNVTPDMEDVDSNTVPDFTPGINGPATVAVADGTLTVGIADAMTENVYYISNSPTTVDLMWEASGINWTTGYTVETRVRVDTLATNANTTLYLQGSSAGGNGAAGWLNLTPTGQTWGSGLAHLGLPTTPKNNADDFHVFRYAQEPEADSFSIWRDDVLLASQIPAGYKNTGLDRFLFGDGGGAMGGNFEMDYLRITPGAYSPVNEIVPTYTPPATIKVSDDFTYKYEMDVDPTDQASIDLDANGAPDWVNIAGSPLVSIDGNGMLLVPNDGQVDSGITNPDGIWPNVGFTAADGFTYEIRMQIQQNEGQTPGGLDITSATPIAFTPADNDELTAIYIAKDSVIIDAYGTVATSPNDTAQHTYRISRDSDANGGAWWVWRDGELLTPEGYIVSRMYPRDATYFGPGIGGASSGSLEVDYVRLMNGAFAPEEVIYIPGDANHDGVVDDLDAAALADNWQTQGGATWGMGDFNDDGNVDDLDATILATNWQTSTSASVPEPGMLTLLALASMSLLLMRREAA